MSKMFNKDGQLNANNLQDALSQIVKYASIIEETRSANEALAGSPSYNDEERDRLLKEAMLTPEGKISLGQAMANPIRRNLDFMGMARKILLPDALARGALPVYERDIDVAAAVVSSNGSAPESRIMGDRVEVPLFEIISNPTVRIAEVKNRRFNLIDRAQQKASQEVQAQEDANVFATLDYASDTSKGGENAYVSNTANGLLPAASTNLHKAHLAQIKQQVDQWDLLTTKFVMHITKFNDILMWGAFAAGGTTYSGALSEIDMETQREILKTGLYGRIWGADILVNKLVPKNRVFGCADPEFLGVMPIRQDIEVLPADEPKNLKLGWVVNEIIGIAVINPRGVAAADLS